MKYALCSSLYRKVTAGNTILHASSFHPKPLVNSIPHSQYLQVRRNCSDDNTFLIEAAKLRDRLLLRGYSRTSLKKAFKRANTRSCQDLLYSTKPKNEDNSLRIITKYSNQHQQIRKIVSKYWHILHWINY